MNVALPLEPDKVLTMTTPPLLGGSSLLSLGALQAGQARQRIADGRDLQLLLAAIGIQADPLGDATEIDGTTFSLGYELGTRARTLRIVEPCPVCRDPQRSLPITTRADVDRFAEGGHRDRHRHHWLSGSV